MAMAMEEVVVRLIIDQPAWLLYPEPILPDVQSLTHHTPQPKRSTARFPGVTEGDSQQLTRGLFILSSAHQGRRTRRQKVSCIWGSPYSPRPPARAIRPYGAQPRSLLIIDSRKEAGDQRSSTPRQNANQATIIKRDGNRP